ncbi:Ldh family oxidoreductase [Spongiactinospora sp. TRM90649]|uniref:Ldh family oxidoreductase n=1 Tax=Spongiactinospora sp. TRM90649 TaxID=3031114 RepID=UPI0023F9EC4F|nr:Ldh family oxidoreductase [Spongiactinospora sp. TRM90649]MDF5754318.1 Ldh family oxidoreductase [Spongiactinospora sp. TRM90649]
MTHNAPGDLGHLASTGDTPPIAADRLVETATRILVASGLPDADARLVADCLVQADLWGHQSHGLLRLGWYVNRLRSGVMTPRTAPETVIDGGAVATIDGHDGVGQVLAAHAAREATARAARHGIGAVAVRNSNHFGMAAHFTRMAPPAGCIGILTTNSSPAMAPWGGRVKAVGSNPWSIAVPIGDERQMVLDISNTAVARGKIYLARNQGAEIPDGWAITAEGRPTRDPVEAIAGTILPMAAHKGYAISVMMDVLSGVLTGSGFGTAVAGPYQAERRSGSGHLYIALEIAAFMRVKEFTARMAELVAELKAVPSAEGAGEVLYPGEVEERTAARNLAEGVSLPGRTLDDLRTLAAELDVVGV